MQAAIRRIRWPGSHRHPVNRQNAHIAQQLEVAYKAIEKLGDRQATVTSVELGGRMPLLRVQMPLKAACLPGTLQIRRPCEVGVETIRRAVFEGCCIEWSIGGGA